MSNKVYDGLKFVSLVLLPALASLYFALGEVWSIPFVKEVVATITILDTFLGLLLRNNSKAYQQRGDRIEDKPIMMGDLVVVQEVDGHPMTVRMEPKDKVPIFEEGRIAGFRVKRETLE